MQRGSVYSYELRQAIEGPAPGLIGFFRWLFEPIRPAPTPALPEGEEAEDIRFALDEFQRRRRLDAEARGRELDALHEVLGVAMVELDLSLEAAITWAGGTPLRPLGGRTAVQAVSEGDAAAVLRYVRSISSGYVG